MSKKYGLIPASEAKKPAANFARPSVFGDESSDDDAAPRRIGLPNEMQKRQAKLIQDKAMEEDPTIYQYDEVYDDISTKRAEEKAKKSEDKKPKYITKLLQAAEKRKIENERRVERQVQKEREAEGEQFKDKEAFVTASYRKKLEELKKAEEEEAREAYLESIGDVRKQGNLDGFYRHIYSQKLDKDTKPAVEKQDESHLIPASATQEDSETEEIDPVLQKVQISKKDAKTRSYRKRNNSEVANNAEKEEDDEEEEVATKKAHLQSNLDADSDFSIDSSSDDEETEEKVLVPDSAPLEFVKQQEPSVEEKKTEMGPPLVGPAEAKNGHKEEEVQIKKEKVDIWKKRTVGDAFDAALQRYYERKALREQ